MKALKILMVSETVPARQLGGLAKHAVTLANAQIAAGHQVSFMGLAGADDEACRREMGFNGPIIGALELMPGWKEGLLGCFNPFKRPYFARRMADIIMSHASEFDVIHYHGNLPLVAAYIPDHVNFVQTRHDQGSECLIHVRFRDNGMCMELNPSACASCATPHPNGAQRLSSTLAAARYREVAALALARHKTIFVSEAIRRNARRVLPESAFARSYVIHNFVDQQLLARETQGILPEPGTGWQILIASRLDEAKGVGQFLLIGGLGEFFPLFNLVEVRNRDAGFAAQFFKIPAAFLSELSGTSVQQISIESAQPIARRHRASSGSSRGPAGACPSCS